MRHAMFAAGAAALVLGAASADAWADRGKKAIPFDDVQVYFEINSTDEDAGIQMFVDGDEWHNLVVFGPSGGVLGHVRTGGTLKQLGIAELFFESGEPEFGEDGEVTLEELLAFFPEGEYSFFGRSVEGELLIGTAELTHDLPAAANIISPAEGVAQDPGNIVVIWDSSAQPPGIEVVSQEVIVEIEDDATRFKRVFSVDVGPHVSMVAVPAAFFDLDPDELDALEDPEIKAEVLVREASGNRVITEREFELAE